MILTLICEINMYKKTEINNCLYLSNKKNSIENLYSFSHKKYHLNLLKFQKTIKNAFNFLHIPDFNIISNLQTST